MVDLGNRSRVCLGPLWPYSQAFLIHLLCLLLPLLSIGNLGQSFPDPSPFLLSFSSPCHKPSFT